MNSICLPLIHYFSSNPLSKHTIGSGMLVEECLIWIALHSILSILFVYKHLSLKSRDSHTVTPKSIWMLMPHLKMYELNSYETKFNQVASVSK